MARGRPALTREEYVHAAIAYVDVHGSESLTLRSLGDALGVAHTALYRHFRDKAELVGAMTDYAIARAADLPVDWDAPPGERIVQMAMNMRAVLLEYPHVAVIASGVSAPTATDTAMTAAVIAELEAIGVPAEQLPVCYQALESFVLGSQAYDLAGAPDHLEQRRQRLELLASQHFADVTRSTGAIAANNDAAFEFGVRALVAACHALARGADLTGDSTLSR